ncbi:MAG TPA: galactose oxidase-like domain-containing protein [Bryobacteraceae bacterium]|jgi:hypothetical protein|nr:galactose oxidase-like domain-containing protein [Bryobacteraceae bacterium]
MFQKSGSSLIRRTSPDFTNFRADTSILPVRFILSAVLRILSSTAFVTAALAQTCPTNIPHTQGTWRTLPYLMPINPISATLMHNGKVLIVAGSENDASNNSPGSESYRNAIWDPAGTTQSSITVQSNTYDVFCSGTAALPDGRPLVVGGTSDYSFKGDNRASIFDPATGQFAQSQSMADGRWYGTATALGDGRVMAFSGLGSSGSTNKTVEIYDLQNAGTGWTSPVTAPFTPPLYPRMFVLPNGKVFFTGQGDSTNTNSQIFDPVAQAWTTSAATTTNRTYGSAVLLPLLPPAYTPKVMNFGGGNPATATTETIDLSTSTPAWTAGPSMSTSRIQMNAVMLPNGKVLAEGGSVNNESPDTPGKQADLYDPASNTMSSAGWAAYSRLYHSSAVLLPDATVVSMGSNPGSRGGYQPAIEIYTPPYLYDANDHLITTNRPSITGVSSQVLGYNAAFSVNYTSTSGISSAVLVRLGSATHAFNMDQRLVGLCGLAPQPACNAGGGTLGLTSPPNGNIAPPGYYMLFLLDTAGVPSVAKFVQLSLHATAPPRGTISSPASDVSIPAGSPVAFGTTSSAAKYSWVFPGGSPTESKAQNPGNVTFSTPGTYVTSLTVVDANGNSDPSPPTRTVTVLPATGDFSIAVTPSSRPVLAGQSATFTVAVTPMSGFSGSVTLSVGSESGFPAGITSGGFSPATITGSGSSTLTMNTTTTALPYALSLTVTGATGSLSHSASTTLLVNLAAPASLTANSAAAGSISLSWPSSIGATSYHLKRALVSGGPYEGVACTTATTYTNTGLVNGTTYYYVVSASYTGGPDAGGESADSTEAHATPQSQTTLPAAPTNMAASPGAPRGSIRLRWTQSTSSGVTQNKIYRRTSSGTYGSTPAATISATSTYLDLKLASGASYCYVVTAVSGGLESARSPEACAKTK